eukprot:gene29305-35378_t
MTGNEEFDRLLQEAHSNLLKSCIQAFSTQGLDIRIDRYYPHSLSDLYIQNFNLHLVLPPHLRSNAKDSAQWLLEESTLDRQRVFAFFQHNFTHSANLSHYQQILYHIASQISSIEVGQGYVEGLKYFLPVIGLWNVLQDRRNVSADLVKTILRAYTLAHYQTSKRPFLQLTSDYTEKILDFGVCVIEVFKTLYIENKPHAQCMSDFFSSLRAALRNSNSSSVSLSIKHMTDMFVSASSSVVQAIKLPASLPSYYFSVVKLAAQVKVSFSFRDRKTAYQAKVTSDALYLFQSVAIEKNTPVASDVSNPTEDEKLVAVLPLDRVHIERCGGDRGQLEVLELTDIGGRPLPLIYFALEEVVQEGGSHKVPVPTRVQKVERILLEILPPKESEAVVDAGEEEEGLRFVETWGDILEGVSWECRAHNRTPSNPAPAPSAVGASQAPSPAPATGAPGGGNHSSAEGAAASPHKDDKKDEEAVIVVTAEDQLGLL